jgi:hypothetical protein
MLKRVQHDTDRLDMVCHPELVSGSLFLSEFWVFNEIVSFSD